MALYAFDGTWNEDEPDPRTDTNVVKFQDYYTGKIDYVEGVGTRFGALGRFLGGMFGAGGKTRIEEMYDKLIANWQDGDKEIDIIGFSRGAALAVHFSNVIDEVGIKINDKQEAKPKVRFLGIWDIVGAFGIPINFVLNFQDINIGYDLEIPNNAQNCFHAMSLNERRQAFDVTRLDKEHQHANVEELWFRGVHSDVGGGSGQTQLSDISLKWMLEKAELCRLPIDAAKISGLTSNIDPTSSINENLDPIENPRRVIYPGDQMHQTAVGKTIKVGESAPFKVRAPEQFSWSGVKVEAGAHYCFVIAGDKEWRDKNTVCGPDGWQSEALPWYKEAVFEALEDRRRCSKANWFELIGAVGDDGNNFFRIGLGGEDTTFQAPETGELFAFANDLKTMYGNNHGELEVKVKRVATAGNSRCKTCEEE